jgi:uncharacterized protein
MNPVATPGSSLVIDCDVHVAVPSIGALHPYLTEYWRDGLREAGFKQPQGIDYTFPDWSAQAIRPSDTTPDEIAAQVLGAADLAILNCCYGLEALRHPYLAAALATAVNSWLQEEWLARDGRFLASLVVAVDDPDSAVAEIRRVASDPRFVQVLVAARSWEPLGRRRYWPIWEAAVEHGLAVGIHAGGLAGSVPTPVGAFDSFFEDYVGECSLLQTQLISFIAEGVLDTYPDLRLCLLEGGVTWAPTLLWKLDTEWKGLRREIPWVRRRPSEYVRDQVRMSASPLMRQTTRPSCVKCSSTWGPTTCFFTRRTTRMITGRRPTACWPCYPLRRQSACLDPTHGSATGLINGSARRFPRSRRP